MATTMVTTEYWVFSKVLPDGTRSDETWSGAGQLQYPFKGMEHSVLLSTEANLSVLISGVLYTLKTAIHTSIS